MSEPAGPKRRVICPLLATGMALLALVLPRPAVAQSDGDGPEPYLATPPELVETAAPELPRGTVFPTEEVVVVLEIEIDEAGAVQQVFVKEGFGEPFDGAAQRAALGYRFTPGVLNTGEAVPLTITYRLRIPKPPPPPVRFSGQLLERGTRTPLVDVVVAAKVDGEAVVEGLTDAEGRFALVVPAAEFLIVAAPPSHELLSAEVSATPGEERGEVFYLEKETSGFEIVVRAKKVRREVTKQVITKDIVARIPGAQGDTIKVVYSLPGVARAPFGGGLLVLRGANPGDSRTFLEGLEIPQIYHLGGLRSTFNSYFLEAVEFVPGNIPSQYGRATGGIIDVQVRDPATDMFRGEVDLNVYDAGFAMEGPLGKGWSMGGAFHRSYIDSIIPAVLPSDAGVSFDSLPRYYDYQFLTSWKPDDDRHLQIVWFGSLDKVELVFKEPSDDPTVRDDLSFRSMFHSVLVRYESRVNDWLRQESQLGFGYEELSFQIGPDLYLDVEPLRLSMRSAWDARVTDWFAVRAGLDLDYSHTWISGSTPFVPLEGEQGVPFATQEFLVFSREADSVNPALFVDLRFTPMPGLEIVPSVRLDYFSFHDEFTVDPRLYARWQVLDGTALKAGVGLYQQPPEPNQLDKELGNPNLFNIRSVQASLGVEQRIIEGLELEVTGFYKWLDRVVSRNPELGSVGATEDTPQYKSLGEGRIFGVETLLKASFAPHFTGWIAYTYQRSFRRDAPGEAERLFDFDQPHILTLVGTYTIGAGWSVGLRFRFVSGNPDTPVTSAFYDASTDTYVPRYGATNSVRQSPFHQLDIRVDKIFTFERWKLDLYLEVQNVYYQGNQEGTRYSFDYSEKEKLTGLPILPVFGVKGTW